jgi:hypothetical protein
MVNTRESEIREESLSLTVAAYEVLSSLDKAVELPVRQKLIDDSFMVSSLVAEAFSTCLDQDSEKDIRLGLIKLLELKALTNQLRESAIDQGNSIDRFGHLAEELQVDLLEVLSAITKFNSEDYSPKLEIACF